MRIARYILPRLGLGTIVAWLVAAGAWLAAAALLWPTIRGTPPDSRRTGLALSLLSLAFANWLMGLALRGQSRPGRLRDVLLLPLPFQIIVATAVDLLAVLIALLLLTSISLGAAETQREVLAANLGLIQSGINFLGVLAAIITNTLSLAREWKAQRER